MPPKKNATKKIVLKSSTKKATSVATHDVECALKAASNALKMDSVDFDSFIQCFPLASLNDLMKYLRHDRTNLAKKIECVALFDPDVKKMMKLRDYLDNAINKSCDIVHDAIVNACSDEDNNFDINSLYDKVNVRIGVQTQKAEASNKDQNMSS
ncbi:unnamed protein product [Effrenium voratum]|nr:unnamed protein product [Effrenium voratum]